MPVSKEFITAGNATFTIEVPEKGRPASAKPHYTFKVRHKPANGKFKECWFVSALTGPNNETDFTYLGMLDPFTGQVRVTAKSCWTAPAFGTRLLNRILARIWGDDHDAYEQHGYRTHHEGCCGRCGRTLTVPESVQEGLGPECRKHMGLPPLEKSPAPKTAVEALAELAEENPLDLTAKLILADALLEEGKDKEAAAQQEAARVRHPWHFHPDLGDYSAYDSDLGGTTPHCPKCNQAVSLGHQTMTDYSGDDVAGWRFKHDCGADILIIND